MNRDYFNITVLVATLLWSGCSSTTNDTQKRETMNKSATVNYIQNPEIQAKGMKQIKGLIETVKPALMASMKKDKTGIEGMKMCSTSAQEMGKQYNALLPQDSKIRRTALKYRNPKNKPDATDVTVMKRLKDDNNFEKPLIVDMGESYRVYKALPMHKPCLLCHGELQTMSQEMKNIIKERYPNDLAVNFKEHEFRGVIVSTIKK